MGSSEWGATSRAIIVVALSAALAAAAALALAQQPLRLQGGQDGQGEGAGQARGGWPRPVGEYEGVTPGKAHVPDHLPGRPGERPVLVTWPGFQQRPDGASRFFVQTTSAVQTEMRAERRQIVVVLKRVRLPVRNNRRPLETLFFNTPVTRARMVRRRQDAALVLELRANVTPRVTSERGPNGYHFVFVEFPAGQWRPANIEVPQSRGGVSRGEPPSGGGTIRIRSETTGAGPEP